MIFATSKTHKLAELRAILTDFEIKGLMDIGIDTDIPETGLTLEENAYIKAKYLYDQTGKPSLSEDTGLEVDSLLGNPGVHTARYAGEQRNPIDNPRLRIRNLLQRNSTSYQFQYSFFCPRRSIYYDCGIKIPSLIAILYNSVS